MVRIAGRLNFAFKLRCQIYAEFTRAFCELASKYTWMERSRLGRSIYLYIYGSDAARAATTKK